MADYVFDFADDKGFSGKTLKEMWHEERTFVEWLIQNKLHLTKPALLSALTKVQIVDEDGNLQEEKDKISSAVFTKMCGCDAKTDSPCCSDGQETSAKKDEKLVEVFYDFPEGQEEAEEVSEEEEEESDEEERQKCPKCGEDADDHGSGVSCWKCNMAKSKCEGCQALRCNDCDNFRCNPLCTNRKVGDHCQCGDSDGPDDLEDDEEEDERPSKRGRRAENDEDNDDDDEEDDEDE
jgi:hypothetical protein